MPSYTIDLDFEDLDAALEFLSGLHLQIGDTLTRSVQALYDELSEAQEQSSIAEKARQSTPFDPDEPKRERTSYEGTTEAISAGKDSLLLGYPVVMLTAGHPLPLRIIIPRMAGVNPEIDLQHAQEHLAAHHRSHPKVEIGQIRPLDDDRDLGREP